MRGQDAIRKEYNKSEFLLTAADIKKSNILKNTSLASLFMVHAYLDLSDMIKHA